MAKLLGHWGQQPVIYPEFYLNLTQFYPRKHWIQFLANRMQNFWNLVLHNCILIFDAKPQALLKTLNPNPPIHPKCYTPIPNPTLKCQP